MSKTAQQLIREVGRRLGEYIDATATGVGLTTTLVATGLNTYWPVDVDGQFYPWVYPIAGTVANQGREARGSSWRADVSTLTLVSALPAATAAADTFEIHLRTRRSRKLEALNDAVGMLGLYWARPTQDTSLTTVQGQWAYAVPNTLSQVSGVEVQADTSGTYPTFPFMDASPWNWRIDTAISAAGVVSLTLRFGGQPPPGRTLRITGESYFSDLALDADVLALGGSTERPALSWIYDMAKFRVLDEVADSQPAGEAMRYRQRALDALNRQKDALILSMETHQSGVIKVPGRGDAQLHPDRSTSGWEWLGAYRSP